MANSEIIPPTGNSEEELRLWREQLCRILNETKETADAGGGSSTTPFTADTPETPTGISATGGFGVIVLTWTAASYTGHSHTEIWASTTDSIGTAEPVGSSFTNTFTHPIASPATSTVYYYWIRHINSNYEAGAFSATSVSGSVDNSASYSLELLVGSLGYDQFQAGTVPIRNVDPLPTLPDADYPVGSVVFLTTDGKLYRNVANVWNKDVDGADLTANSIVAGKIAAGAIVADAVGTNEIIASAANIGNGVITSAKIGTGEIKTANIADANITTAKIADANITNAKIANLAVDSAKIASAAITEAKIGSAAVTEAKIGTAAVTNAKIGSLAVSTLKIQDNAVTVPVSAYSGTTQTFGPGGSNHTIISASIDSSGQPVFINFAVAYTGGTLGTGTISFALYRGTTSIFSSGGEIAGLNEAKVFAFSLKDTPGSGSNTYYVKVSINSYINVNNYSITLLGVKK